MRRDATNKRGAALMRHRYESTTVEGVTVTPFRFFFGLISFYEFRARAQLQGGA
jgi:hypothetical protein